MVSLLDVAWQMAVISLEKAHRQLCPSMRSCNKVPSKPPRLRECLHPLVGRSGWMPSACTAGRAQSVKAEATTATLREEAQAALSHRMAAAGP
mmetsp:Transcript_87468/g.242630  ORF Transcript_87468/g.242630 Transcript_87468/m.242630 type:complete len:93 (+) Transcript_87468:514-792(+)